MAYFTSLWQARIIENHRIEYENEKFSSLLISNTEIPRKTVMQRWRIYGHHTKRRMTGRLKKWFPEGSSVSNLYYYLKMDQTFPNFVLKSIIGFLGGIVLTYLCFMFFVFQLSISLMHATIMSSIIGVLLTLGLAFSYRIRCLVFLLIPQFFSRVGRYTLTCYALVLILTGPATNTLRNSEVLSESMACSQEQIKSSVRQISESMKTPFNSMKESIKLMVDKMKRVTSRLNDVVSKIGVLVLSIGDEIQSSLNWLSHTVDVCNKKFGTPYDHCMKAMNRGLENCKKALGSDSAWICNPSLVKSTCLTVKPYDSICVVADYAKTSFAATLRRRLKAFTARVAEAFFIDIETHHTHSFSNNASATVNQVAAGIVTEIRNRADPLLTWLSWSSCVTSLFLLLIIFRAKYYQQMYETRSRFDNRYVTKELRELDFKRYLEGRETVLPLNRRERAKYISIMSYRLIASEKIYLTRSIVFMTITTFKLLIHMVADYSLYWILMKIRYHGRFQSQIPPGPSDGGVHISGTGFVSDLIRSLFDAVTKPLTSHIPSPVTCLPNPHPPDMKRYTQIVVLILLLWFFALLEPYGLRLRHVIMGHYRPERAKARAVWLYNHILRTRGSFMKLARRKLHREYKYALQEDMTFRQLINSCIPCWCLKFFLGKFPNSPHCLLCNTLEDLKDADTKLISCETMRCPGVYCVSCFSDIGKLCTICLSPGDYGDMSDVSMENGSSDESDDEGYSKDSKHIRNGNNERTALIRRSKASNKENPRPNNERDGYAAYDNFSSDMEYPSPILNYNSHQHHIYDMTTRENEDNVTHEDKMLNYDMISGIDGKEHKENKPCRTLINQNEIIDRVDGKEHKENKPCKTLTNKKVISSNHMLEYRRKFYRHYKKLRIKKVNQTIFCRLLFNISQVLKTNGFNFCSTKYNIKRKASSIKIIRKSHARKLNNHVTKEWKMFKRYNHKINKNIILPPSVKVLYVKQSISSMIKNCSLLVNSDNTMSITDNPRDKDGKTKKNHNKKCNEKIPKRGKNHTDKKKRCEGVKKMCSICSKCLISMKRGVTPSKQLLFYLNNNKYPCSSNKTNFKRRKKETEKVNDNNDKANESDSTRNYRISTYLFDDCWIKERNGKDPRSHKKKPARDREDKNECLKLNLTKAAKCLCPLNDCICKRNRGDVNKSTGNKRLSNFRKRIYCSNLHRSTSITNEDDKANVNNHVSSKIRLSSSRADANIARRMNYYRTLGISDFEEATDGPEVDEFLRYNNVSVETTKHSSTENSPTKNRSKIKFDFDGLSTSLKSFKIKEVKLGISERFLHLRIRNPLPVMRDLYVTLLEASKREKSKSHTKETVEKGVLVLPAVESQSCQCINRCTKNRTTQVYRKNKMDAAKQIPTIVPKLLNDVALEVKHATCTCATQYQIKKTDQCCSCIRVNATREFGNTAKIEDAVSQIFDSSDSLCSLSDDTKTDTTICSRVAINYEEAPSARNKTKRKTHVVTKANQSTTTEKAVLCDVSTLTNDWWSPIEERKLGKQIAYRDVIHRKKQGIKHRAITPDGRIVTFRSKAQIIPSDSEDILSPSRYLLESQKYYNELFSSKIYSSRVLPAIFLKDCGKSMSSKDSITTIRKGSRKINGKPKRLDKRGSPSYKPKIGRTRSEESSFEH